MTRAQFEKLTADLLERTKAPFRQVIKDAGINVSEIASIRCRSPGSAACNNHSGCCSTASERNLLYENVVIRQRNAAGELAMRLNAAGQSWRSRSRKCSASSGSGTDASSD